MSLREPEKLKIDKVLNKVRDGICPECGEELKKREGEYGDFWGCSNYPDCDFSINDYKIEQMKKRVKKYNS